MRIRTVSAVLASAALLTLTACANTDNTGPSRPDTSSQDTDDRTKQDTTTTETSPETPDSTTEAAPEAATLPDLVGQDLQAAQDEAQAAGFYVLDDQDAGGQNRLQVFDRNWTVCSQDPEPGTHPTDTPVTLYAVKDDETC
ncbi:PASTA domain-containing protein [Streptomyces sp. NBC_01451]|uniref:PASTA domain-containing protein n=1 Tax=Streptomyces sp. NBC_01451 TaxID=2903872 RepID=UPI002E36AC32|nr:PASTA domain-containing protein [Streptomyces sp. NBC_01451]